MNPVSRGRCGPRASQSTEWCSRSKGPDGRALSNSPIFQVVLLPTRAALCHLYFSHRRGLRALSRDDQLGHLAQLAHDENRTILSEARTCGFVSSLGAGGMGSKEPRDLSCGKGPEREGARSSGMITNRQYTPPPISGPTGIVDSRNHNQINTMRMRVA